MDTSQINAEIDRDPRMQVLRREERRYACGCSTTRIEAFAPAVKKPDICHAHQQHLVRHSLTIEYSLPEGVHKTE